jgi:GNAT superfamily N-acetyltransferase
VWSRFQVGVPHIHLSVIGVRRSMQGRGLGRVLLEHVQELSRSAARSQGVTLTTEDPINVPFYEHAGYEIVGHARIADELETWGMFRRNGRPWPPTPAATRPARRGGPDGR